MKLKILFFLVIIISSFYVNAQKTLVISSDDDNWQDVVVRFSSNTNNSWGNVNDKNYENYPSLDIVQWTWGGEPGELKSLVKFDLSALPQDAKIKKAYLSLYVDSKNYFQMSLSAIQSKAVVIQRITSDWDANTVTWNSQPNFTKANQVVIKDNFTDYENIDVTKLIKDFQKYPNRSFGFMFSSVEDDYYNGFSFASSDNQNADLHPKLTIIYTSKNLTGSAVQQNTTGNVAAEPVNSTDCGNNQNIFVYNVNFELVTSENNVSSDRIAEIIGSLSSGNYLIQLISADADVTSFSIKVK